MMFDLSHFKAHGFQKIPNLLGEDKYPIFISLLNGAQESINTLMSSMGVKTDKDIVANMGDYLASEPDKEIIQLAVGHLPLKTRMDPILLKIAKGPKVQKLLKKIFPGQSLRMHMPPTARYVLPNNTYAGVPPHQDVRYNEHMTDFVTLWFPFVHIDERCGGVEVYLDTNKQTVLELSDTDSPHFWARGIKGMEGAASHWYSMKPGDALLLNKWVVHKSMPNTSDRLRLSVDCRFFGSASASSKHYLDMDTWEIKKPK